MVKNYLYMVVGILSILFSFTHAWNGEANFLPIIYATSIDLPTRTTLFYVWHVITAENAVFGAALLVMAFQKDPSRVKFAAWMIASIMIARWGVIFLSTLLRNINELMSTLTDLIVIIIFVGLLVLGARQKREKAMN